MPSCRSCQAPIRFAATTSGRQMPIDDKPHTEGNLVLYRDGSGVLCCRAPRPGDEMRPKYHSHFATCPKASQHRKDPQR